MQYDSTGSVIKVENLKAENIFEHMLVNKANTQLGHWGQNFVGNKIQLTRGRKWDYYVSFQQRKKLVTELHFKMKEKAPYFLVVDLNALLGSCRPY